MNSEEFVAWLELLELRDSQAAHLLCCDRASVWRWKRGGKVPRATAKLCRYLQAADVEVREKRLAELIKDVARRRAALDEALAQAQAPPARAQAKAA